jgi:hypothetical protein
MCPAFPDSDYYGSSAPSHRRQQTTRFPFLPNGFRAGEGPVRWFPCSLSTDRRVRRPAMPLRLRRGYAAAFHHGLLTGDINRSRSSPPKRVRIAAQPISARFGAGVLS